MHHLLRSTAYAVLAAVVGALTIVGYLALFVAIGRYPIQSTAIAAVLGAIAVFWFQVGERKMHEIRERWKNDPPDSTPEDAAPKYEDDDPLRAVLTAEDYAELSAYGTIDFNDS